MKAILKFKLPEEISEFKTAQNALQYKLALWDFDNFIRSKIKYGHKYKNIEDALNDIRAQFYSFLDERDIGLDQ